MWRRLVQGWRWATEPIALRQPTTIAIVPGITYAITLPAQPAEMYEIAITRQGGTAPLALTVYDPTKGRDLRAGDAGGAVRATRRTCIR
jgi:hypothetical protein